MAMENKKLLLPSLYQVLLTVGYFVAWVAALIVMEPQWSNGMWTAVGAIALFGSFLIFYFFCGVTVNMVDVHIKGGTPSIGEGIRDARKNFVAIVFLALVSTIVDLFAQAARDNDSIVGKIVAGIIEAIWTTLSFLLLPAIIIEDAGFGAAMRRVRELHKGHMLLIGIGEVGVRLVTGLIGFVWILLVALVVFGAFSTFSMQPAIIISFVIGGTMLALYSAFATFVRMAYYTCLYVWAAEVEAEGQSAPAPLPLARALGRTSVGDRAA